MELRDYQKKAIDDIRASYRAGHKAPLLCLPTGGGKTVIFSYIAQSAAAKGKRVLILVHRRELAQQTSETLKSFGVDHGIIASGHPMDTKPVQVASVQTLARRLERIKTDPGLIVVDEAHHAVAGSWEKVIDRFSDSKLLGVTATPMRLDGKPLDHIFDALISGPSVKELTEAGFLAPSKCFTVPAKLDRKAIGVIGGDFKMSDAVLKMSECKVNGDAVVEYRRHCSGKPAVVFCCNIAHAEFVADLFSEAGYKAAHLSGKLSHEIRKQRIQDLGRGKLQVLTSCDVISEGTDIPAVAAAILLRPTQSEALYLQQVGRALRISEGKDYALILDCVGNIFDHGMPDAKRNFTLHGEDKLKAESVRECPDCFAVMPSSCDVCPECGHVFEKETKEVEPADYVPIKKVDLVEITEVKIVDNRPRKKRIAEARTFKELDALRKEFGYKPGWTYVIMRERTPRACKPVTPRGQNWSALLAKASIPEPPGYQETAKMVQNN
jgi:superfamily II DNA or RNA helicase